MDQNKHHLSDPQQFEPQFEGGGKNKNRGREHAASEKNHATKKQAMLNERRNITKGREIELSENSRSEWDLEPQGKDKAKTTDGAGKNHKKQGR